MNKLQAKNQEVALLGKIAGGIGGLKEQGNIGQN
jgi:hypothetical protein